MPVAQVPDLRAGTPVVLPGGVTMRRYSLPDVVRIMGLAAAVRRAQVGDLRHRWGQRAGA